MKVQKRKALRRVVGALAVMVAVIYVAAVGLMTHYQREMLYPASRVSPGPPAQYGVSQMKEMTVRTDDNLDLLGWFIAPKNKDGKIAVLFHGSCCDLARHGAGKSKYFFSKGYGVLLAEYRGYGGNPGTPSEEGLYKDARAFIRWLLDKGYSKHQLVFYGNSLGTGVAVQMAVEFGVKYLILEAPYTSVTEIASNSYPWIPVKWLMRDKFDSLSKIEKVKASLLIVHGDKDTVIPIHYGRQLFEAANEPKEFITVAGGQHGGLLKLKAIGRMTHWLDRQVAKENRGR